MRRGQSCPPEVREKIRAANRARYCDPALRSELSEKQRQRYRQNPELRDQASTRMRTWHADPINAKAHSERMTKSNSDPAVRAKERAANPGPIDGGDVVIEAETPTASANQATEDSVLNRAWDNARPAVRRRFIERLLAKLIEGAV